MSQLIVVLYPAEYQAMQVMLALQDMHNRCLGAIGNVALLCKDDEGRCQLSHSLVGAYDDETWMALMDLFVLALSPDLYSFARQFSTFGIDEHFIERLHRTFSRKSSALFILMPRVVRENVFPVLSQFGGIVLQTSLSEPLVASM